MPSKIAVIVPCYKRPEYTAKCIKALEDALAYPGVDYYLVDDGSEDGTDKILQDSTLPNKVFWKHKENRGLRSTLLHFLEMVRENPRLDPPYKYIVKMDADCVVPADWLHRIMHFFELDAADILSPNVEPSNAAFKYGRQPVEGDFAGLRRSAIVGGLWAMKASLLKDIQFEDIPANGLTGAFSLLEQIIVEKEPRVAWLTDVTVQDIGHWSGQHPEHIKSEEHREYSAEVGRRTAW